MLDSSDNLERFDRLRRQAEKLIDGQPEYALAHVPDVLELIHELRIHQAELELQNDELKRAQLELAALNKEYTNLYEFAPCGYITLSKTGIINRANLTATRLLGENRERLLHRSLSNFISPDWESAYLAARQFSAETGRHQNIELPINTNDNNPLWVSVSIEAERSSEGYVSGWRLTLSDITQQKLSESALIKSEGRLWVLFENAPIAYQALDINGNVVAINQTWLTLLGYSHLEVIGHNFAEFLTPEGQKYFEQHYTHFKEVGEVSGVEFTMLTKDGREILISTQGKINCDEGGVFKQSHCVLHDITAERKAEEEKKEIEKQLRQAQKMESIGTLAGGVAHEFNNMLAVIMGNNDLALQLSPSKDPLAEHLQEIKTASLRAREVVQQLLDFSHQHVVEQQPMQLAACVEQSLKLVRSTTPANISIKTTIDPDLSPILGSVNQMNQVVINLCSNARDAMLERGGNLQLVLENFIPDEEKILPSLLTPAESYVKLSLSDNGSGIEQEVLDHIFEPYFTTKEIGKGSGIGLALVHGILEQHKGAIEVESVVNEGTTFSLYIPAYEGSIPDTHIYTERLLRGSEHILFIDDESALVKLGLKQLSTLGYQAEGFTNPEAALKLLKINPDQFDLVITDMAMPEMMGDLVADEVQKIRPDLPVILCTGYSEKINSAPSDASNKLTSKRTIVMKPLRIHEFAATIRKMLDRA